MESMQLSALWICNWGIPICSRLSVVEDCRTKPCSLIEIVRHHQEENLDGKAFEAWSHKKPKPHKSCYGPITRRVQDVRRMGQVRQGIRLRNIWYSRVIVRQERRMRRGSKRQSRCNLLGVVLLGYIAMNSLDAETVFQGQGQMGKTYGKAQTPCENQFG